MSDEHKTTAQLLSELAGLRQRVAESEASEAERRQAEKMLRESELKYRAMFEASTDAIFLETLDGQVLDCNRAACAMLGYTREECLRLTVADLVPPDITATLRDVIAPQLTTGGVFVKTFNKRKNGLVFPVEVSAQVAMVEGDPRVIAYVRDITDRERATEALTRHMQELAALYDTSLEINAQQDLAKLLPAIVERAARLIGAPMGGLYLLRPAEGGEALDLVVSYNLPRDYTGTLLDLGEGLSGRIAQTGETMVVENYNEWDGRANIDADSPFRRALGVPLKIENRVIGVINVTDTERAGPYSEEEIRSVALLANQAAIAIRNAQLYEASRSELAERKRAEQVQSALYRISEATQVAKDLEGLYHTIHAIIGGLMPAQNFYIALFDASTNTLCFPYYRDEFDAAPPPQQSSRGLTGYVLETGKPLLATPDVYDQLIQSGQVEPMGSPSVDWLGVPLKVQQTIIGVMAIQTYSEAARLTQSDKDVLVFVSTQVAMAIERKRAEETLRASEERYRLLFESAPLGILSANPQGRILKVNPTALKILGSPSAEATQAINVLTFPPLVEVGFSADLSHCIQSGQSVNAECSYTSKWGKAIVAQYRLTPIFDAGGQVILVQAILEDITESKRAEQDIRRLNQDLVHRAEELTALNQAGRIMASTLDMAALLSLILAQVKAMLDAQAAAVIVPAPTLDEADLTPDTHAELYVAAANGPAADRLTGMRFAAADSLPGWVIREKQPVLVPDAQRDPRRQTVQRMEEMMGMPTRSYLAAPLMTASQVVGVVVAVNKTTGVFDEHDQAVLEALCGSAAIALDNARLLAEARRRAGQLTRLYDAGLVLNRTLDPREQLEALSRIAMQALRADNSGFFRYDAARNEVYYEFGVGRGVDLDVARELRVQVGTERGLVGWVAQNRAPFYLPDVTADPRWIVTDPEIRSAFWVPVQHEDQLLGLLSVSSTRVNAFTPDDQRLLALFANQVAASLENARLYQAALTAAERRTILHWLSQEIVGAGPDPERINAAVHQAAARLMPAEAFVIALLDEARGEINLAYRVDRDKHYPSHHVPRQRGLSGHIIASGQSLIIGDIEQESHDFDRVHFGDPPFVRSILAVPMRVGSRVLGMLSAQSYQPHAYTAEDSPLLEMLAAYAAIALENARLYAAEQERTTALADALARQRRLDLLQREFIQNVSHELRTPLAIIQGHAEMLDSGWLGDLPPAQRRSIGVIVRRTQMLTKLVDNITFLIDTERRELVREPVDLTQLVRVVLADYQPSAENADLILSAEGEPDLPRVSGDVIALRRVLDHVIGNALKFTPAGGRVMVRLSRDAHAVVLQIADTGVGIPADQLERVFERFYQVDGSTTRRYGGVGLGLALAKQVVEAHDGQITVTSEIGVGTTCTIRLPAL